MCGRYKISTPGDELWESFDIHGEGRPVVGLWSAATETPSFKVWFMSSGRRCTISKRKAEARTSPPKRRRRTRRRVN